MNLYPATAFIRHLLTSRSAAGHGVHSPFVFDFLTEVVRGKGDANIIHEVEMLRHEMLADRRTVRVTDLGAGSAMRLGEERSISEIASSAALPARQLGLLVRVAHWEERTRSKATQSRESGRAKGAGLCEQSSEHTRSKVTQSRESVRAQSSDEESGNSIILELGTSLAISTLALSLAAPEKRVVTVEGCPALTEIARDNLLKHGAANADVINMEFSEALEMLRYRGTTVSLAFIDGNHRGRALKQYAETIRSMGEEMLIVADDIHLNSEMYRAWCSLASSGIAAASMETFRFGILFCLHNLTPGHYRIRY